LKAGSARAIAAVVDGLGVALESSLLTERGIAAGKLVRLLRDRAAPVRYVGHYLSRPKRHRQHAAFVQFKQRLLAELEQSRKIPT